MNGQSSSRLHRKNQLMHEIPMFKEIRNSINARVARRATTWGMIYDTLYSAATVFANHQAPQSQCEEEPEPQPLPNFTQENYVLDPNHLVSAHGEEIMHRMLWGATYSAYLYDFLKQLQWDTSPNTHTQWVELLISFKLLSALHTPVSVIPKIKEYQSPSIQPQLSRHATLGLEVKAFASAVLQLESITGEKLIPGIRTKKTRLHRSYSVNSPNTGVTFRAAFPRAMEVRKILNEYFLKQPCKRRMNPTLNFDLDLSLPPINLSVHPVDAILMPKARATNWQRWYQMVYYQSRKASRSRSETA